jgi:hypothetical protein
MQLHLNFLYWDSTNTTINLELVHAAIVVVVFLSPLPKYKSE